MTSDLTPAELTDLRRLLEAATPGPWRQGRMEPWHIFTPHGASIGPDRVVLRMNMTNTRDWSWSADAALIAALVNAAPRLIEMAERAVTTCAQCGTPIEQREWLCLPCRKEGRDD